MQIEMWKKLFGKNQDDPAVKTALRAASVKKIPKLGANRTDVRFDLKGHGLMLIMTDEAYLKELNNQGIGKGPLILSGVSAYLDKSASSALYKGKLPYTISAGMTKVEVRKALGSPSQSHDENRWDVWLRDDLKIFARYTKEWKLRSFGLMLPRAE